ncbi:MAG: hypothetical protein MI749_12075, partial [Desulfovibrionales bacterium]|nr:hypothetical protein [Desulfovibrionales bacterium]
MEVAVTLPVSSTFTYAVPSHLSDACQPGMRVLVPFGRRRITGYILGPIVFDGGYKVKNIIEVLDDDPLFPASAKTLFKWTADYYLHPLGEVIKTALPSGLERRDVCQVSLTPAGEQARDRGEASPGEGVILDILSRADHVALKQLLTTARSKGHPSARSLVRRLEDREWLSCSVVLKREAASARMEKFLSPGPVSPDASGMRMSMKRKMILTKVADAGSMSLTLLKE